MNSANVSPTLIFVFDVALTAIFLVAVVVYIKRPLQTLLVELCGTAERANFWLVFSNVALVVVPLIFALDYKPEFGPERIPIFEMAAQLKYSLVGLVTTLGSLAFVLSRFIPREKPVPAGRAEPASR